MELNTAPNEKPTRRTGNQSAFIVLAVAFSCLVSFVFLFSVDKVRLLQTTINLQFNGATTTGTVIDIEEFKGAASHNSLYKLTVGFEADGQTYQVTGNAYYPARDHGWQGESMDVIYDPEDPAAALIDTFGERWLIPFTEALP